MTKNSVLLRFDINLLLLRHGKNSVLTELSKQLGMSSDELSNSIGDIRGASGGKKVKEKRATFDLSEIIRHRPDAGVELEALAARYENRTFLDELRDVRRFLERHGRLPASLKSRDLAKRRVFEVLASLERDDIRRLLKEKSRGSSSSLGLISDQILRRTDK